MGRYFHVKFIMIEKYNVFINKQRNPSDVHLNFFYQFFFVKFVNKQDLYYFCAEIAAGFFVWEKLYGNLFNN
jgi:hypothetical protein